MNLYRADLHVHTVLSPCAGVEMIPPLIVETALKQGIHLIAITDHNATANIRAVRQAAEGTPLQVLAGMELQTREEVHLLCLFDTPEQAETWQGEVDTLLPNTPNRADLFGEQFVVDETGDFVRREERLLLNSALISLEEAARRIHALGGLAIPAHVNRRANGLLPTLGIIPPGFDALEISRHISAPQARQTYPQLRGYPLIQSGDVHYLDDFWGKTLFWMPEARISEMRKAFLGQAGCRVEIAEGEAAPE